MYLLTPANSTNSRPARPDHRPSQAPQYGSLAGGALKACGARPTVARRSPHFRAPVCLGEKVVGMPTTMLERAPLRSVGAPVETVAAIRDAGRWMDARGWVPATAGNISIRIPGVGVAITRSGTHKGGLRDTDVMLVDLEGRAISDGRPSAETGLHCQVYREDPRAGAVLHGHSVAATVLSLESGPQIEFTGFEIVKAFPGYGTHESTAVLPIFENDQDIARLSSTVAPFMRQGLPLGYLIRGHGVYVWGPSMPAAMARLEGLEFLLSCELERRKIAR